MAYAPFSITATTTPKLLTVVTEADIPSSSSPVFQSLVGSAIEFDVGAADIYVGPDTSVSSTGNSYNPGVGNTSGTRGRKYVAGTHVEMKLNKGDILYVVTASGSSILDGSVVGA